MRRRHPRKNQDDLNVAVQAYMRVGIVNKGHLDCLTDNKLVRRLRGRWVLTYLGRRKAEALGF
jgi:hypothetical protein